MARQTIENLEYMDRIALVFPRLTPPNTESEIEDVYYRASRIISAASINEELAPDTLPNIDRPARARDFYQTGDDATTISDGTVFTEVTSFYVERDLVGVVTEFWLELESDAAFENVQFRIVLGRGPSRQPVRRLHNIRGERGSRTHPVKVNIAVPSQTPVIVEAMTLTTGATHYARAGLIGYTYEPADVRRTK